MGNVQEANLVRYLPHVALTTSAVILLPVLAVAGLRNAGLVPGLVPLLICGLVISLSISTLGAAIWKTRPGSGDILFSELMAWGFLRRWRIDRHLSTADRMLGVGGRRGAGPRGLAPSPADPRLLERLAGALEARDPYTHGHSRRVARHSEAIARRLGLSDAEVSRVRTAAAIHDIGKVKTPAEVLGKSGRLSDDEFATIKKHPVDGAEMASGLGDPALTEIVRHHHERIDGGGYPDGLSGKEIPKGARIIAVADTFDAITSARPYRPATTHKKALGVMRAESGTQLDAEAVEAFCSYYSGLRPVAIWTLIAELPQRLAPGLFDGLGAGVASTTKTVAAATAAAVVATAAAGGVPAAKSDTNRAETADEVVLAGSEAGLPGRSSESDAGGRSGNAGRDGSGRSGEGSSRGDAPAGPSSVSAGTIPVEPTRPEAREEAADSPAGGDTRPGGGATSPGRGDLERGDSAAAPAGDSPTAGDSSPGRAPSEPKEQATPNPSPAKEQPGGGPPPGAGPPPGVPGANPPHGPPPAPPGGGPPPGAGPPGDGPPGKGPQDGDPPGHGPR